MKKVFYLFSLVLSFVLFSCEKDNIEPKNPVEKTEEKTELSLNVKYPKGFDFSKEVLTIKLVEQTSKEEIKIDSPKDNKAIKVQLKQGTYNLSIDNANYSAVKEGIVVGDKALTIEVELMSKGPKMTALTLNINYPKGIEFTEADPFTIKLKNLTTQKEQVIPVNNTEPINISLEEGKYSLTMGNKIYSFENKELELKGKTLVLNDILLKNKYVSSTWVIKELHYTSTYDYGNSDGYRDYGDNYIELYNNSDKTLYADGLCITRSQMNTNRPANPFSGDKYKDLFVSRFALQVPGNGKEHPVAPGQKFLIAVRAGTHKIRPRRLKKFSLAGFKYYDLSSADFSFIDTHGPWQTYVAGRCNVDQVSNKNVLKLLNEDLPFHPEETYTIAMGYFSNREVYAIFRLPDGIKGEEYFALDKMVKEQIYTKDVSAYTLPLEWIIDAVQTGITGEEFGQNLVPSYIDAGYTHCANLTEELPTTKRAVTKVGYEKAMKESFLRVSKRKVLKTLEDGRVIFQDTNNSTEDFEHNAEATAYLKEYPADYDKKKKKK